MTDTGQVPGEGLPENAGMVEQPGVSAPGAYTFLDPSENPAEDDDLLLMPGAQGAWGNEVAPPPPQPLVEEQPLVHEPGPHETAGRDSGSLDLSGVRVPGPAATPQPTAPRRPLHLGPPTPDGSASPVRSLADRGPAAAPMATPMNPVTPPTPVRHAGPPTTGPEYLDVSQLSEIPPQGAVPWGAPSVGPEGTAAETVVPSAVQGPEAGAVAEALTVPEAAPVAEAAEPAEFAPVPQAAEAVEVVEAQGFAQVPQAPETGHMPEASEGHFVQQAVEVAPSPEAGPSFEVAPGAEAEPSLEAAAGPEAEPAPDGFPAPEDPTAAAASTPFPVAQDLPHLTPTADDTAGHLADTPARVSEAGEPLATEQVLEPAQDPQSTPAAEPQATEQAPQLADQATHLAESVAHPVDQAPRFPAQAARFPEAGVHTPEPVVQLADTGVEPASLVEAPQPEFAPEPLVVSAAHAAAEAQAQVAHAADDSYGQALPGVEAFPVQAAQFAAPAEAHAAFAEAGAGVPVGVAAHAQAPHAATNQSHGEHRPGDTAGAPGFQGAPLDSAADQSFGQFVPVEGTVPTTPHLAPTPPHAMTVPPLPTAERPPVEEPPVEEPPAMAEAVAVESQEAPLAPLAEAEPAIEERPVAPVPAPREAEAETPPVPEPFEADPEPVVVAQQADDLDTQVADQEESTAAVEDVRESTGPAAPGYDDAEREAVLRVMRERRDIRNGFRSDPIPHDVLLRVLEAAHTAPSVGHSQPWDFVVIRSAETRRTMHELAARQREAYAKSLPKGRAKQFKELKIEAILDTPVNIVVTADPTRGGRHTLGRHTQPQMAPYSSALAVQNLWLAARAEGLGVGWVSFFDEREMVRALGLPEHLDVVAYLCVGYVDEFPEEPELMQAGWSKRRPLSWVVHEETYGRRALPGEEPHDLLAETVSNIRPLDAKALGEAWERQKRMTKPAGALGMLEIISAQLSGLSRMCPPPIPEPAAVAIFAGDHGVHAQGVTPWPQEVTGQMVANFLGGGAVCNAFANQVGAEVCVVDVGVASDLPATPGLLPRKVRAGTADMTTGPAMTREEVTAAIEVGIETARDLVAAGNKALLTGEMGIANTTASAALISVFTDSGPSEVTGRGTGINDETLARKTEVVRRAIELHQPDPADPIGVLAAIGGLEHAAMVGLLLGGASLRTPVILDGVSAGAAALVARAIAPEVLAACIAGHRSAEPGHVAALNKLGLRPLIDLDLRLGEGTGALLALPVVQSAARAMHEVATFDSAGVTEK
ncbi:nicotinate-nucleotide-dimethylbenzimidazole phosphoribosyltransferase /cob(II)yrinic acid a,c-diamide reductase [Streptomyces sp. OV198]|uniref:nicotinate-nucleotide--dimethylbenzimidazole phosphoribosyltransferase n=1 Tax=Streptomyces sp. OV198 TaxID=1882787 RepID=UPI000BDAE3E7|nr:nicotinate-nucleotide--dimethylbenzimidazole phosphoribosyltransferase [Streptomyces sp. OV198]SOE77278.1 nicotinate-nucleotide-dimethylbenzimidazole phosphoribosyltransferase /cob(II)yrinic acid a,c-diamide reductase [Streptomyces sp. OV198]